MAYSRTEHIGRIAVKDELKLVSDGYVSSVRFRLAVDRDYKNRNGEVKADFFNCAAYSNLAEYIYNNFKKGDTVLVVGRNSNVTWNDGNAEHHRDEILLERCIFIHRKGQEADIFIENKK